MLAQNFMLLFLATPIPVSGLFVVAGWRYRGSMRARRGAAREHPAEPRFDLGRTRFAGDVLDVAAELRDLLVRLEPHAARHLVPTDLAVQPGLAVHADP